MLLAFTAPRSELTQVISLKFATICWHIRHTTVDRILAKKYFVVHRY